MNYKKSFSFLTLLLLVSVFAVSLASAAGEDFVNAASGAGYGAEVSTAINAIVDTLSPVTGLLFGVDKSTGDAGFITLMALLISFKL